jgi:alcohol dehydrogenase (cytochrome c)
VNRGVSILGNTLYMGTIDAHLIALDARDGKLLWDIEVAKAEAGYAITHAPLIVKNKVIVGTAGGEFGIRGFIAAYEAATGKEAWRFYTIPGPDEPGHETWEGDSWMHGGASVWVTGSYDPDLNLTYWGIGNPGPDWNGDKRAGDNLYSSSVVALDADTGKLKWYFQFTPHDVWDYDSTQVPVLADISIPDQSGRVQPRKTLLWGNRNGFFYVLDRTTGKFIRGKPFSKVTWATGLDDAGRPVVAKDMEPSADGVKIYPGAIGPPTASAFVQSAHGFDVHFGLGRRLWELRQDQRKNTARGSGLSEALRAANRPALRGAQIRKPEEGGGVVRAMDPKTGERKWEYVNDAASGILTTVPIPCSPAGVKGSFRRWTPVTESCCGRSRRVGRSRWVR